MKDESSRLMDSIITPFCTILSIVAPAAASINNSVGYTQNTSPLDHAVILSQPLGDPKNPTMEMIYKHKVDQIRPIGDWSTYDYIGAPTISRKVFVQIYIDMGSPLAKYAGDIYDMCVRMGLDPNWYLAVAIEETSLGAVPGADHRMNPCNVRYASGVLPSYIEVPLTNGISDFSQAKIHGQSVSERTAYMLATYVCAANLKEQHDIVIGQKGKANLAENTIKRETPQSDHNNTPEYWASMQNGMENNNLLSIEENPPIQMRRIVMVPVPQIPIDGTHAPAYNLVIEHENHVNAVA